MPKIIRPLTATAAASAKPGPKPYKLRDGGGLHLLVYPQGGKAWRLDYRRPGGIARNTLSLGPFPAVSLADAREQRDLARKLLANGLDPSEQRQQERMASRVEKTTLESVANSWLAKKATERTESSSQLCRRRLETYVFPVLGHRAIASVTAPQLVAMLGDVASTSPVTAKFLRREIEAIFRYAIATGAGGTKDNPAAGIRDVLPVGKTRHRSAITDPTALGNLLRAIDAYQGDSMTAAALKLTPMLFQRPAELRTMEWAEIDLDAREWRIPAEKMKQRVSHLVPLPEQAVAILRDLKDQSGHRQYVLTGQHDPRRPLSRSAVGSALRQIGFSEAEVVPHGFRATARTLLDEVLGFPPHIVEQQLAHSVRDPLGRAYNRTAHLPERRQMLQRWADYLDSLRTDGNVVPIKHKAASAA